MTYLPESRERRRGRERRGKWSRSKMSLWIKGKSRRDGGTEETKIEWKDRKRIEHWLKNHWHVPHLHRNSTVW